jgi:hypothetical protein
MANITKYLITAVCCAVLLISCKIVSDNDDVKTIDAISIENGEISGWNKDASDGYVGFNTSNMEMLVNGGSIQYTSKGMVEGFEQNMTKYGTDRTYKAWVLDFGTAEKAAIMYNTILAANSSEKEASGLYPETVAFLVKDSYGYSGYANFGKYFVSMSFDGYGANTSEAKNNVVDFLQVVKGKIDAM